MEQYETRTHVEERIIEMYLYGSRVYGTHTKDSDFDWIMVVESDDELYYSVTTDISNITVFSESMFIKRIQEHHVSVLECIFQDRNDPYLKYFELDLEKLRRSISSIASNSFSKCKKKLAQGDEYIGKKSLFHSLRILNFGYQIALHGRIVDFSSLNYVYQDIMKKDGNWEDLKTRYQPLFNSLKSDLRRLAPLEGESI